MLEALFDHLLEKRSGTTARQKAKEQNAELREIYLHYLSEFESYHLVYVDESGCDKRIAFRRTGWFPLGVAPRQVSQFHRDERYQILPAYAQDGVVLSRVFRGSTDATVFEDLLMNSFDIVVDGLSRNAAFAYHEPPITTILNQTGFLVVLNLVNVCLDRLLYCGLIGQLFVGILWGTPGAKWFDRETETVIQQLGYLGLIMLVYEGGLSTSIKSVRANLVVSLCVAITGIGAPMGLSFILNELVGATSLQAFAAGAALSATSLGTTFTILSTTNLISTRLGTVTTSAAMLDDVVGLVMVQIISNLGGSASSFSSLTVIRPVFVSIGFAVGLLLLCAFFIKPMFKKVLSANPKVPNFMGSMQFAFLYQTVFLVGLVAGATYAGTSSLFAAYLAGVIVTWFDGIIIESKVPSGDAPSETPPTDSNSSHIGTQGNDTFRLDGRSKIWNATSTSAQRGETPTGEKYIL
ncbi:hypothetical protein CBS147354_4187 [Penicillium roqueforti]|nr:hypothetical protein CBS147354_4187 [Penicillium roqueforti]